MFARLLPAFCLLAPLMAASPADAGNSSLVRIEPRPYYGAVVTIEQGVRVWRSLPRTQHMVINPTNAPVNVNITDIRETVTHRGHGGDHAPVGSHYAPSSNGGYYLPGYGPSRFHRFRGHAGKHPVAGLPVRRMVQGGKKKH